MRRMDPVFGYQRLDWKAASPVVLDGANDEQDETED